MAKNNADKRYFANGEIQSYEEQLAGIRDGWVLVFWDRHIAMTKGPAVMSAFHCKGGAFEGSFFRWDEGGGLISAGSYQGGQLVHGWALVTLGNAQLVNASLRFPQQDSPYRAVLLRNKGVSSGPTTIDADTVQKYIDNDPALSMDLAYVLKLAKELRP